MIWSNNFFIYPYFENETALNKPPTLFGILDDILNYGKDRHIKIKDFASEGREHVFDFDYPTSDYLDKTYFEEAFIDHFLTRRIGTETFTAFQICLRDKLRTIMPFYNVMFDALGEKFNLYNAGSYTDEYTEETTGTHTGSETENTNEVNKTKNTEKGKTTTEDERREERKGETDGRENGTTHTENQSETETEQTTDDRFSDTPQNHLDNVRNGEYVTDYRYDVGTGTSSGSSEGDETRSNTTKTTNEEKTHNRADTTINDNKESNGINSRDGSRRKQTSDGDTGSKSYLLKHIAEAGAEMLLKYQQEAVNIFDMIWHDCDDLFYQLF